MKFQKKVKLFFKDIKGQAAMETMIFAWFLWLPMMFWMLQFSYIWIVQENLSVATGYSALLYNHGDKEAQIAKKTETILSYMMPVLQNSEDESLLQINIGGTTYPGTDGFNNFPPEMEKKPSGFPMPGIDVSLTAIIKPVSKMMAAFGFDYEGGNSNSKPFTVNATTRSTRPFSLTDLF